MILCRSSATTYLVEQYLPHATAAEVEPWVAALAEAADRHARSRCSIFVPDDDLCFHVLTAASPEAAVRAAELAGITPERTIEATAWLLLDQPRPMREDKR
ncbi:MAG: hypothetical protein ACJ76I_09635 [Gaiellaceae bacterium]